MSTTLAPRRPGPPSQQGQRGQQGQSPKKRIAIDGRFLRKLRGLLQLVMPSWRSKPALLLALHTAFLMARTFVSILVVRLDGALVKAIVDRNGRQFAIEMAKWLTLAWPACYINSMIKFLEGKVALAFRTELTAHSLQKYCQNDVHYRVSNLDGRLANADQCLTQDITAFSTSLAHLWSHLSKPAFDVALISWELLRHNRSKGHNGLPSTIIGIGAVFLSFRILRAASPPFGAMVKEQAELEGQYRFVHSRLIANAEEVAFYGGEEVERSSLWRAYSALVRHLNSILRKRIFYSTLEGFCLKYFWSACGLFMVALPSFLSKGNASSSGGGGGGGGGAADWEDASVRTQDFVTSRGLLTNAADAIERIMSSYKEVTELAGYTHRVSEMLAVFDDMSAGKYVRTQATATGAPDAVDGDRKPGIDWTQARGELLEVAEGGDDSGSGHTDGGVYFDGVPIVTPAGDVLVDAMTVAVPPGRHLLITGPNGCGKSSFFRTLGGLWPVSGGRLTRPPRRSIFYIPQKPYLSLGSLRDQLVYPHSPEQAAGTTDADLDAIMAKVHLAHIVRREGGWDATKTWEDVLSGGEKQRVGLARLFYHRPRFAILDECTSAVSIDVEGEIYQAAKDLGVTLLTVSHRPSLWKYHSHLLSFDGEGGYRVAPLKEGQTAIQPPTEAGGAAGAE